MNKFSKNYYLFLVVRIKISLGSYSSSLRKIVAIVITEIKKPAIGKFLKAHTVQPTKRRCNKNVI